MTNSEEDISDVLNEDDAIYLTLTQEATANQYSAFTQPTKSRQLNPTCDSLRNLNVDDNIVMKGCLEEIPDRSVAGLSIDGSHIKRNVFKSGRSLGMVNMRVLQASHLICDPSIDKPATLLSGIYSVQPFITTSLSTFKFLK